MGKIILIPPICIPDSNDSTPEIDYPPGIFSLINNLGADRSQVEILVLNLNKEVSNFWHDTNLIKKLCDVIISNDPDCVGFSSNCINIPFVLCLSDALKIARSDVTLIIGGPGVSSIDIDFLLDRSMFDSIFIHEAEITFKQFISEYFNVLPLNHDNPLYEPNILAQTYPETMKDEFGNYLFEYYVDLAVLRPYMSGSNNSATREFYHINPEIYWHGTGQLIIDYITIEDEFSRSVRLYPNSSAFISQLNTQNEALEESDDYDNLIYLMSMDEPRAGQLQMYKEVQNRLKTFTPARKLITAMWQ